MTDRWTPTNTARQSDDVHLAAVLDELHRYGDVKGRHIEEQERLGQAELVNSTTLPVDTNGQGDEPFLVLGFTFGEKVPGDPMFRDATLPAGWSRKGSDHAMWSYIVDERGIERVAIFYKAAFYDRSASMNVVNVGSSVASTAIYDEAASIPWEALTPGERAVALDSLRHMLGQAGAHPDIYGKYKERTLALIAGAE